MNSTKFLWLGTIEYGFGYLKKVKPKKCYRLSQHCSNITDNPNVSFGLWLTPFWPKILAKNTERKNYSKLLTSNCKLSAWICGHCCLQIKVCRDTSRISSKESLDVWRNVYFILFPTPKEIVHSQIFFCG